MAASGSNNFGTRYLSRESSSQKRIYDKDGVSSGSSSMKDGNGLGVTASAARLLHADVAYKKQQNHPWWRCQGL